MSTPEKNLIPVRAQCVLVRLNSKCVSANDQRNQTLSSHIRVVDDDDDNQPRASLPPLLANFADWPNNSAAALLSCCRHDTADRDRRRVFYQSSFTNPLAQRGIRTMLRLASALFPPPPPKQRSGMEEARYVAGAGSRHLSRQSSRNPHPLRDFHAYRRSGNASCPSSSAVCKSSLS